jgi:aryl-alcohol dehydrogenase-like predicted oxidoreductase
MKTTIDLPRMRTLGRTGLAVSPLGFGAASIGLLDTDQKSVSLILNQLLDSGVNLIDTAGSYAGSEEAIGKAVSHRRDEYILVSKCGQSLLDLQGREWSGPLIRATVDRTLKRLRTDRIDVMLLHSCGLETLRKGEAIAALIKAREAGKILFAGYSGDNEAAVFAAQHSELAVVEASVSIVDQSNIDTLLPTTRENGTGVIAKRPIGNAAWRPLGDLPIFYQEYARPYHERFEAMELHLEDLGIDPRSTDWAEVALRFTLSQPGIDCAIVGTTNLYNATRNVEIAAMPPLSARTIQILRQAFFHARHLSGEDWPGLA